MSFQLGLDLDSDFDDDGNKLGVYTFTQSYIDTIPADSRSILSLFDLTGEWSRPYREAGYQVAHLDIQSFDPVDVMDITREWLTDFDLMDIHGILCALPCTDFAGSGARWWAAKDADGSTEKSIELAEYVLSIIEFLKPSWWVLENPVGRLPELVPTLKQFGPMYFNPCDFGDPYTKKTGLWGEFNRDLKKTPVEPVEGSKMHNIGPRPDRQYLRSVTPPGFSKAFFEANP